MSSDIDRHSVSLRTGFALPVVLLVMLIVTIVGMVMLERQSSQALTIGRQVSGYDEHHASRGMKETIDAWLRNNTGRRALRDRVDSAGRAFEIDLPTGLDGKGLQTLTISLFEGQGTVLTEFTGFAGQALDDGKAILQSLHNAALPAESLYTRSQGPIAVSAVTASPEVLRAAVDAATGGEGSDELVDAILKARDEATLSSNSLSEACNAAKIEPEMRAKVLRYITADPTLFKVVVEVRRGGATGPLTARYQGLAVLAINSSFSRSGSQPMTRSSVFLTWEKQDAQQIMMEAAGL